MQEKINFFNIISLRNNLICNNKLMIIFHFLNETIKVFNGRYLLTIMLIEIPNTRSFCID
jgi:hypothetical protein